MGCIHILGAPHFFERGPARSKSDPECTMTKRYTNVLTTILRRIIRVVLFFGRRRTYCNVFHFSTRVCSSFSIGVLLGVLGGAAAPPSCWRSRKFIGCRKFLGVSKFPAIRLWSQHSVYSILCDTHQTESLLMF